MKQFNTKKLVLSSLFSALACVCTMALTIPTPTGGYVHAGDCFVILSGVFLGPLTGGFAAGIGSMFSDIFLGYISYAPATFIIKFLAGFTVGLFSRAMHKYSSSTGYKTLLFIINGIISSTIVVIGYFLYEWLLTNNLLTAAVSGIMGNVFQGIVSILLSTLVYILLQKSHVHDILQQ